MIVRVVKLTLRKDAVNDFKLLFEHYKDQIRQAQGCCYLELIEEVNHSGVFMTYSHWEGEEYLELYRKSELFGVVWPKTKAMFAEPAQAWTLNRLHQLK